MATFEVTGPDGSKYQVTAPDDASQSDIMAYVQKQSKPKVDADSLLPKTLEVAGRDTGIPLPQSVAAGLVGAGKTTARILQGVRQLLPGDNTALDAQVAQEKQAYAPLAEAHPLATGLGETLPAFAIPLGAPGSVMGMVGRSALANAAPGALSYGTAGERAGEAGVGAAGGGLGALGGAALGRVLNPVRAANPAAMAETQALAQQYGVNLRPAQATGSKALAGLEGTLAQLPGSAGVFQKVQQSQGEAFNKAAMATLGESGNIGNDSALLAKQNIGGRIQSAAAGARIPVDDALLNDLAKVEANYGKNLSPDQRPIVGQYMDDILSQPTITGDAYQAWRSRIGARAAGTSDSELKGALKGIQGALDSAFDRAAGPEASAAMVQARGQYRNFKTLEPLIAEAGMTSNNIPPMRVMSRALATKNTQGEMSGLAQLGRTIGREYPNSGTAPRLFWQNLLTSPNSITSPSYLIGATGIPLLAAKTLTSSPVEKYLTHGLLGITPEMEKRLIRLGGLLGFGTANAAAQ